MLIVISPAKTLDYETPVRTRQFTRPAMLAESRKLVKDLRNLCPEDLTELMHVSDNIAQLNFTRYLNWQTPFTPDNARQAIFAFKGDVYTGMEAQQFRAPDLKFAQQHLRILSGLYGVLRPLDLMQPYRLEMGTPLANCRGRDLYEFWGNKVTDTLDTALTEQKDRVLINLASNEYFKVIDKARLKAQIITPVFRDYKNGQYKVISFFAKKARGMMASWIIRKRLKKVADLEAFAMAGYRFNPAMSSDTQLVYTRKE